MVSLASVYQGPQRLSSAGLESRPTADQPKSTKAVPKPAEVSSQITAKSLPNHRQILSQIVDVSGCWLLLACIGPPSRLPRRSAISVPSHIPGFHIQLLPECSRSLRILSKLSQTILRRPPGPSQQSPTPANRSQPSPSLAYYQTPSTATQSNRIKPKLPPKVETQDPDSSHPNTRLDIIQLKCNLRPDNPVVGAPIHLLEQGPSRL